MQINTIRVLLLTALLSPAAAAMEDQHCDLGGGCQRLDFNAGYTADIRRNTSGGVAQGTAASGLLELGAAWVISDELEGTSITTSASVIQTSGDGISGQYVGDLQGLNNIEAPRGWRLYEVWTEIQFGTSKQIATRAGLLDLNAEFDAPVTSAFFIGPPFGIGTDIAQTGENGPSVFPVTSLGIRAAGKAGAALSWRVAAFDGVAGHPDHNSFADVRLSRKQGALLIGELDYTNSGIHKLALGAWSYTATFEQLDALAAGASGRKGNRGAYLMLDMPLGALGAAQFDGMIRLGVADGRFNPVREYVGAALVANRFLAGRPDDAVGIAIAHGRTSHAFRRALAFDGAQPLRSETAVELTYRAPLREWLAVVPSLQWVDSPGADDALRDAWVVGARFEMSFSHSLAGL